MFTWALHVYATAKIVPMYIVLITIAKIELWPADGDHVKNNNGSYAAKRDNAQKHHPLLVPYNELIDKEKQCGLVRAAW